MEAAKRILDLVGRALIGSTFVYWGGRKLVDVLGRGAPDAGGWTQYMERFGVAGDLLPLVILTELGCGIMLLVGCHTRAAALALAGFCALANYFFHAGFELPPPAGHFNWIILIKNLALAGGLLCIAAHGSGAWSVDAMWRSGRSNRG